VLWVDTLFALHMECLVALLVSPLMGACLRGKVQPWWGPHIVGVKVLYLCEGRSLCCVCVLLDGIHLGIAEIILSPTLWSLIACAAGVLRSVLWCVGVAVQ
jgi:hypothetical protein